MQNSIGTYSNIRMRRLQLAGHCYRHKEDKCQDPSLKARNTEKTRVKPICENLEVEVADLSSLLNIYLYGNDLSMLRPRPTNDDDDDGDDNGEGQGNVKGDVEDVPQSAVTL